MIHLAATIFVVACFLALSPVLLVIAMAVGLIAGLYVYINFMLSPGIVPFWVWMVNIFLIIGIPIYVGAVIHEKFFKK